MNTTRSLRIGQTLAGIALAVLGSSAFATSTWELAASCSGGAGSGTNLGTSASCNNATGGANSISTTIYGYSTGTTASPTTTTSFAASSIYTWGSGSVNGLGIVASNENAGDTGPHAIDNAKGTDAMLIKFTNAVSLTGVTVGWNGTDNNSSVGGINYTDSDISVLAYTGSGTPTTSITNSSLSTLLSNGWTLVSNLADVGTLSGNTGTISSTIYSSYWLISAYSSSYGGAALDTNVDDFKLLSVAGCSTTDTTGGCKPPTNVPEPGSLALLGAGLFGIVAARRRRNGQNA